MSRTRTHSPFSSVSASVAGLGLLAALALLGGCASSSGTLPEKDPELEKQFVETAREKRELLARQNSLEQVLLNVDKNIDSFVTASLTAEYGRSARLAASLHDYLRRSVLEHFDDFVRLADDPAPRQQANRAIALAALGFSMRPEALTPILNGAAESDPLLVTNAMLGLGVLQDPRTPAEVFGRVMEDPNTTPYARICASWALMEAQEKMHEPARAAPVWLRLLSKPVDEVDPAILVHAVRGMGLLRDRQYAKVLAPFVSHPTPKVRQAAAIALGRCGDPQAYEALLALIAPSEPNANVRLTARKALSELAGGVDRQYDVAQWRKVFEMQ